MGDGQQTKPYLHVYDLIDAIMRFSVVQGVTLYNVELIRLPPLRIAEIVTEKWDLPGSPLNIQADGWKGDVPGNMICQKYRGAGMPP